MTLAANVTDPLCVEVPGFYVVETVSKPTAAATNAFLFYTRAGVPPATEGDYAAGVCIKSTLANEKSFGITTEGYAIVKTKAGEVIEPDTPISSAATGEAVSATTGTILGYALNASDGTGTVNKPHYIVIKLV